MTIKEPMKMQHLSLYELLINYNWDLHQTIKIWGPKQNATPLTILQLLNDREWESSYQYKVYNWELSEYNDWGLTLQIDLKK